jgi:WD40 repeat protein
MRVLRNTNANPVLGVSFGPGGASLVAVGNAGLHVWDVLQSASTFIPLKLNCLHACSCDPLGRWIYVADNRGGLQLVPFDGGEPRPMSGDRYERHVTTFAYTPDGRKLVLSRGGGGSNRVECWNVRASGSLAVAWSIRDGKPIKPSEPYLINEAKWLTYAVAIRRDGKKIGTVEARSFGPLVVVLRDVVSGKSVAELGKSATSFLATMAFAPDGKAAYVWDDRVLERWDLVKGRRSHQLPAPGRAYFRGAAIHPSGRLVITVSGDGQARYWDAVELAPIGSVKCGVGKLHCLALSHDGKFAAAGGHGGKVALWNVDA